MSARVRCAASLLHHDHVANVHVLDQMAGNAGDDCRCIVRRRVTDQMTNRHPAERSHADARRGAQPGTEPEEKRRIAYVAHDDVGECDVLNRPAVHAFEGKAAAVLEHAIADHNVLETTGRFRAAFDPSRRLPVIGISASESAVEHGAKRETASDVAIVDGDIFGRSLLDEWSLIKRVSASAACVTKFENAGKTEGCREGSKYTGFAELA